MLGLFFLSEYLEANFRKRGITFQIIKLEITIPAVLNFMLLLICDEIYEKAAQELTNYENHKTIND